MKNDYFMEGYKISIPPTVLFSLVSVIPDVNRCVSSDFKRAGDRVYLLGLTRRELGGSELAAELGLSGGEPVQVDLLSARQRYHSLYAAIQEGLVSAAHDLSDGGLGVALAEMAIGGDLGAAVSLDAAPCCPADLEPEEILYSESASRFLVTVAPAKQQAFEGFFAGQHWAFIGEVRQEPALGIDWQGRRYLNQDLAGLKRAWQATMDW